MIATTIVKEVAKEVAMATVAVTVVKAAKLDKVTMAGIEATKAFGKGFVKGFKNHFDKEEKNEIVVYEA